MGRRSWKTLSDNKAAHGAKHANEREERTRLGEMLASASRSFAAPHVIARLDEADRRDRDGMEERLEAQRAESERLWGA